MDEEMMIDMAEASDTESGVEADYAEELERMQLEIKQLKTESFVTGAMLQAGVKDMGAAREAIRDFVSDNLGEDGRVNGLGEKLKSMSGDRETAHLFSSVSSRYLSESPEEASGEFDSDEPGFDARLKKARSEGDFLKALKIKQEAAREGIILV